MLRLLRCTVLIGGALLGLVYGVLAASDRDQPMPIALLDVNHRDMEHTVYSYVPTHNHLAALSAPLIEMHIFGVSPDGLWAYVYGVPHYGIGWPDAGLYKVRLDGQLYQAYSNTYAVYGAIPSPDRQWLVYSWWESNPERQVLVRLRLHDGMEQIIADTHSAYVPDEILIAPDGKRIAYSVYDDSPVAGETGRFDIFLVDMTTGASQNLTATQTFDSRLIYWTDDPEWLIFEGESSDVYSPSKVLAMHPDSRDVQPVMPAAANGTLRRIVGWMEATRLLVVEHGEYEVSGLRIGQATPVWTINGIPAITPDERALIYQDVEDGRTLWQMPIAGGTPQKIATLPPMDLGLQISPDGQWVLIAAYVDGLPQRQLLRVNVRAGTTRGLYTQLDYATPDFAWSPDSQWISVYDGNQGSYWDEVLVIMQDDGSDRRRLEFPDGRPGIAWYEGQPAAPIDRMLIGIAIGLMVVAVVVSGVWGRRRRGIEFPG